MSNPAQHSEVLNWLAAIEVFPSPATSLQLQEEEITLNALLALSDADLTALEFKM
jgi:hypothetical protein